MHSQAFLLTMLAGLATSQSLPDAIAGESDLTGFSEILDRFPDLVSRLVSAEDITILAPSNIGAATIDPGSDVPAIVAYHVMKGVYSSSDFVEGRQFIHTILEQPASTTVTGGQVVQVAVENGAVKVNGAANVVKADITFDNGIIHIIDDSLVPPRAFQSVLGATTEISSLTAALGGAKLINTIGDLNDVTVFAPNNGAFDAISNVELSDDELKDVLSYHAVAGTEWYSSASRDGNTTLKTLQGSELKITVEDGKVMVNDAQVVKADLLTNNGVIHVIDKVLIPAAAADGTEDEDVSEDGNVKLDDTKPKQAAAAGVTPAVFMAGAAALAAIAHL